jgi:hypothetical protein
MKMQPKGLPTFGLQPVRGRQGGRDLSYPPLPLGCRLFVTPDLPALVVFVYEDEERARKLAAAADSVMTRTSVTHGVPETKWERPGRRWVWFACERDAHMGTLRAYRLPAHPPEVRRALGEAKRPELEQREFIDSEYLRRHA